MNIGIHGSIPISVIANMLLLSILPRINVDAQDFQFNLKLQLQCIQQTLHITDSSH